MDQKRLLTKTLRWYRGKSVLVTGSSGYLGSKLIRLLAGVRCEIHCVDRLPEKRGPGDAAASLHFHRVDIRKKNALAKLATGADIIFHFAAQTSAQEADADPAGDFQLNVLPLFNLLEACRAGGKRPIIVFASTVTAYGVNPRLPVSEGQADQPITIYDVHKVAAEKYLLNYCARGLARGAALRLANVYGPGTSGKKDRGIFNRMVQRALAGEPLVVYGSGNFYRDYVYVDDVVRAFLLAPANIRNVNGKAFIIGTGKGYTVKSVFREIAALAGKRTGRPVRTLCKGADSALHPADRRNFIADPSGFMKATGWKPEFPLRRGLEATMESFLSGRGGVPPARK
ncbi:MAG: NAD-dependent epimerase/dehydratase family protein [Elusimicrobiota bacterium]|nr:NAD-dependent epimerase/dehydratase family protein [Elusimicrobiota bacterium]